mmetsp:Transcript_4283/g.10634  ORF Transcript_4283/g.10634 Transcript_4283/m.10634 type:complete len:220 (-) Transcript_4283:1126-1785(-)
MRRALGMRVCRPSSAISSSSQSEDASAKSLRVATSAASLAPAAPPAPRARVSRLPTRLARTRPDAVDPGEHAARIVLASVSRSGVSASVVRASSSLAMPEGRGDASRKSSTRTRASMAARNASAMHDQLASGLNSPAISDTIAFSSPVAAVPADRTMTGTHCDHPCATRDHARLKAAGFAAPSSDLPPSCAPDIPFTAVDAIARQRSHAMLLIAPTAAT